MMSFLMDTFKTLETFTPLINSWRDVHQVPIVRFGGKPDEKKEIHPYHNQCLFKIGSITKYYY